MKLLTQTQERILNLIKRNGCLSVDQLTEQLGLAKTGVRRTLLVLERRKLLQREWQPLPKGRPQLAFTLTSASDKFFINKEGELLERLIRFLQDRKMDHLVEEFFASYWDEQYTEVMRKLGARKNRDLGSRMESLISVLEEQGFFPRAELNKRNGTATLKECHCPISAAAKITDIPCHMESRLIAKVLNSDCKYLGGCQFEIKEKRKGKI